MDMEYNRAPGITIVEIQAAAILDVWGKSEGNRMRIDGIKSGMDTK